MPGKLTIAAPDEVQRWALKPEDARKVAGWVRQDVTVEYWPRSRITEAWARDSGTDPGAASRKDLNFRGYSYAKPECGDVAVIFVDRLETYESATFVLLHELSHLHLPPWSPATARHDAEMEREEERADAVAARLMNTLLGYEEKVYEVQGADGRAMNPALPVCPLWARRALR